MSQNLSPVRLPIEHQSLSRIEGTLQVNAARLAGVSVAVVSTPRDYFNVIKSSESGICDCSQKTTVSELYRHLGKTAALKASKIVGRMDVALEIVQDTFLKLWKQKPIFPDRKAAFVWVYRTTHNAAIDHLRLAVNKHTDIEQCSPGLLGSILPDNSLEDRQLIMRAAGLLSERELQIVMYVMVDGMTQGEIAEVLTVSRKTVVRVWQKIDEKLSEFRREFI